MDAMSKLYGLAIEKGFAILDFLLYCFDFPCDPASIHHPSNHPCIDIEVYYFFYLSSDEDQNLGHLQNSLFKEKSW